MDECKPLPTTSASNHTGLPSSKAWQLLLAAFLGSQLTQETSYQNASDDVAGNICLALPWSSGTLTRSRGRAADTTAAPPLGFSGGAVGR